MLTKSTLQICLSWGLHVGKPCYQSTQLPIDPTL